METNTIITICTAIGTVVAIWAPMARRFDKIENELKDQGQRLSRIEGFLEGTFQTRLPPIKKAQGEE